MDSVWVGDYSEAVHITPFVNAFHFEKVMKICLVCLFFVFSLYRHFNVIELLNYFMPIHIST